MSWPTEERHGISLGMDVYARDGQHLGRVFAVGPERFDIDKGTFLSHTWEVRYDDVAQVEGHDVRLRIGTEGLRPLKSTFWGGPAEPYRPATETSPVWHRSPEPEDAPRGTRDAADTPTRSPASHP